MIAFVLVLWAAFILLFVAGWAAYHFAQKPTPPPPAPAAPRDLVQVRLLLGEGLTRSFGMDRKAARHRIIVDGVSWDHISTDGQTWCYRRTERSS